MAPTWQLARGRGGVAHKGTCILNKCLSHKFLNFQEHEDVD